MNIIDLLEEAGYQPKRKASTNGGEFCSPCPFCQDGTDRFVSWPEKSNTDGRLQGGRYYCRMCGKAGDAITFCRELHGLSYKEACDKLSLQPKEIVSRSHKAATRLQRASEPSDAWKEKATVFINWCHEKLLGDSNSMNLLADRGITIETISKFKLGYHPGLKGRDIFRGRKDWGLEEELKEDGFPKKIWIPIGIVIPAFGGDGRVNMVKIRRSNWKEGDKMPKYVYVSGSIKRPSIYGDSSLPVALVLESELDAMLIQQFASDLCCCFALGGATKPIDLDTDQLLRKAKSVLFCPDFDKAGAVAWSKWKDKYSNIQRILTPDGKGPGDAHLAGVNLREWIESKLKKDNIL